MLPTYVLFTTCRDHVEGDVLTPTSWRNRPRAEIMSMLDRTPVAMTLPLVGNTVKDRVCSCDTSCRRRGLPRRLFSSIRPPPSPLPLQLLAVECRTSLST